MLEKNNTLNSLLCFQDEKYKNFQSALIPAVDKKCVIGVRTPVLRAMARDMIKNETWVSFISGLPHNFFEENQLHAFIISEIHDFDFVVNAVDKFLPYVDNWATCDQMSPKVFAKNIEKLLPYIKKWIKSKHVYTVRFGILCLMRYYLDGLFDEQYADMVLNINSKEYYINMMRAWYFATAAAKQFNRILPYFDRLDSWTRTRAIQKAIESCRIDSGHKVILKSLRTKEIK